MDRYLGLFLLLSVSHGTLLQPEVKARVQSFIEASMKCHHIPGMTLSIVEGKIIRIRQEVGCGRKVSPEDHRLASRGLPSDDRR